MSILVSSRIGRGRLGNMTDYLVRSKGLLPRIEHAICDLGNDPHTFNRAARRLLDKTTRKNDGQSLVISFTEDEFPSAGDHGREVAEAAYEMVRRGAPDVPLLVVAQRDGKGGRWHAHVIVLNHDMATGQANRGLWKHDQWRALNDAYNREQGLEVCGREAELSRTARLAVARGVELQADADLVALAPTDVPKNDVDRYLGAAVLEVIADGNLDRVPDDGEAVSIPLADHPGHALSVRAKGTGLSYAIVDDSGAPVMCAAGARGGKPRRIASTGTKLDKALALGRADATYTRDGLLALLALMDDEQHEQEMEDERERTREAAEDESRARREADRAAEYAADPGTIAAADGRRVDTDRGVGTDTGTGVDTDGRDTTERDGTADDDRRRLAGGDAPGGRGTSGGAHGGAEGVATAEAGGREITSGRGRRSGAEDRLPAPVDRDAEHDAIHAMLVDDAVGDTAARLAAAASSRTARRRTHTQQKGL